MAFIVNQQHKQGVFQSISLPMNQQFEIHFIYCSKKLLNRKYGSSSNSKSLIPLRHFNSRRQKKLLSVKVLKQNSSKQHQPLKYLLCLHESKQKTIVHIRSNQDMLEKGVVLSLNNFKMSHLFISRSQSWNLMLLIANWFFFILN